MGDRQGSANASRMATGGGRIAEIIECRSGGFRLILRMMSGQGPSEACTTIFARLRDAEDYAARVCGFGPEPNRGV
jgi:hypothetical protein